MTRQVRNAEIAETVSRRWPVSVAELRGKSKARRISEARQAAFLLGSLAGHDCALIGRFYNRDRSGVRRGVLAAQRRMERFADYAERVRSTADILMPVRLLKAPMEICRWEAPVPVGANFQIFEWTEPSMNNKDRLATKRLSVIE